MADPRISPQAKERILIAIQAIWAFIALVVAAEMSEGRIYTLIAFIGLCVPIWGLHGIRWTLGLGRLPIWTIGLFLALMGIAICPLVYIEYKYDSDYIQFYILGPPSLN